MLDPIHHSLPSFVSTSRSSDVRILREPNLGDIIPDLLIGLAPEDDSATAISPHRSTRMEAHVMALLERHRGLSVPEIAENIFMAPETVDHTLRRLSRVGVVQRARSGTWRLIREHRSLRVEIAAVEVKLSRWRDALRQAEEYLEFADWSYVVLDGNRVRMTDTIRNAFTTAGVGLHFQYGLATVYGVSPRRNRPQPSVSRVQAVAKLFGRSTADARRLSWASPLAT